jgi:hypothetical protein
MQRQLGRIHYGIEVIDGIEVGPCSVKCRCGAYRFVRLVDEKFIVDGCSMYDLPHHCEESWEANGTGKQFDLDDEEEKLKQIINY